MHKSDNSNDIIVQSPIADGTEHFNRVSSTTRMEGFSMGYVYPSSIEPAGTFLLRYLADSIDGAVDYSRFYDGSEETSQWLGQAMCDDPDHLEDFVELGCHYIDLAVDQLEAAGLLQRTWLNAKLADEEPDYRIMLTALGRAFLCSGGSFKYHSAE